MTLAPRVVMVHRRTELDELIARQNTQAQAAFFLRTRGQSMDDVNVRDAAIKSALAEVSAAIPADWRRALVERADLPRWSFAPGDIVVAVGQDGLVANLARYLDGQPVIGINPEPDRNPGVLVPHPPAAASRLLTAAVNDQASAVLQERVMVEAVADDGQRLTGLNEIFIGQPTHQTARYQLIVAGSGAHGYDVKRGSSAGKSGGYKRAALAEVTERQASSGLLVCTGTGATGWGRSAWQERHSAVKLPEPTEERLAWFVREAWPSPVTGTSWTEGTIDAGQSISLIVESDRLVAFSDGVESDAIVLSWGQRITVGLSGLTLRLIS